MVYPVQRLEPLISKGGQIYISHLSFGNLNFFHMLVYPKDAVPKLCCLDKNVLVLSCTLCFIDISFLID